jgi:hypothetical protein
LSFLQAAKAGKDNKDMDEALEDIQTSSETSTGIFSFLLARSKAMMFDLIKGSVVRVHGPDLVPPYHSSLAISAFVLAVYSEKS